jgi:hypothetical protein
VISRTLRKTFNGNGISNNHVINFSFQAKYGAIDCFKVTAPMISIFFSQWHAYKLLDQ